MRAKRLMPVLAFAILSAGCARPPATEEEIRDYPVSSLEGVVARSGVELDTATTSDGNGALRLVAHEPTTFRLYELEDIDISQQPDGLYRISYQLTWRE